MTRLPFAATAAVLVIAVSACARPDAAAPSATASQEPAAPRYQTVGFVVDGPKRGPELCYMVQASNPPGCKGLPIDGWSWEGLPHEDLIGTQHGTYLVTGTFDGERITVTEPPRPSRMEGGPALFTKADSATSCPAPPGGWAPADPDRTSQATFDRAVKHAGKAAGYAGSWIDQLSTDDQEVNDPRHVVLNVRFTGDLDARERELRAIYGGALCVAKGERTVAEANRIAEEAGRRAGAISSLASEVTGKVQTEVYVVDPALQREFDEEYGPGVVTLYGRFKPVG